MLKKCMTTLVGLALTPAIAALALNIHRGLITLQANRSTEIPLAAFTGGAVLWVVLFVCISRPMRSYILAHELSHMLAAALSGVPAGRLRVHKDHGSVEVARSNVWIALAPYLLPFYTLLILCLHFVAHLWWEPHHWRPFLPFVLGVSWSYHLTFTLYILSGRQSDLAPYGRPGSYLIILFGNLLWLCLALLLVNRQALVTDLRLLLEHLHICYHTSTLWIFRGIEWIKNTIIQA